MNSTNENLIRNVFSSPVCVSKRRRGYRKVGGGWRGQKYYDPPSANSASNTTGAVREGNLRVPSLKASRGALPEHKHALEKWRKRWLLHRQRGRQRICGVQQRGGCATYRGGSGWGGGRGPAGVGGETSAANASPIKPKWGLLAIKRVRPRWQLSIFTICRNVGGNCGSWNSAIKTQVVNETSSPFELVVCGGAKPPFLLIAAIKPPPWRPRAGPLIDTWKWRARVAPRRARIRRLPHADLEKVMRDKHRFKCCLFAHVMTIPLF